MVLGDGGRGWGLQDVGLGIMGWGGGDGQSGKIGGWGDGHRTQALGWDVHKVQAGGRWWWVVTCRSRLKVMGLVNSSWQVAKVQQEHFDHETKGNIQVNGHRKFTQCIYIPYDSFLCLQLELQALWQLASLIPSHRPGAW